MSGNFAIKGGGVGPLMANAILNFHFDYLTTSLTKTPKLNSFHWLDLFLRYLKIVSGWRGLGVHLWRGSSPSSCQDTQDTRAGSQPTVSK